MPSRHHTLILYDSIPYNDDDDGDDDDDDNDDDGHDDDDGYDGNDDDDNKCNWKCFDILYVMIGKML